MITLENFTITENISGTTEVLRSYFRYPKMSSKLQLLTFLLLTAAVLASDDITAEVGKTIKLPSNFTLSEDEKVASAVWQHGTTTLVRSALKEVSYVETRALLDVNDYSLRLERLEFEDTGEYTLRIVTTHDSYVIKRSLKVLASPSLETNAIPAVINEMGQPQDVAECLAEGGSASYTIDWYDDAGKLVSNNATNFQNNRNADNPELIDSKLVLKKTVDILDNDKQYTCVLVDVFNSRKEQAVLLKVTEPTTTVQTTTIQAHPMIVDFPTSPTIIVMLGDTKTLPCEATGVPDPMVGWTKDGQQIGKEQIGQNEISLTASRYSSAGEYKCVATNQEGTVSKKLEIEVHGKPEISETEAVVNGTEKYILSPEDSHVTLVCQATAIPLPEITWTADEKNIDDFEVTMNSVEGSDGVTSYLNVSSIHFSGEESISKITCIARNKHGIDEKSFIISVAPVSSSRMGVIIGIVVALVILIPAVALLYFFLVVRRRKESSSDAEKGGSFGFATCCGGSKVKSKELREEDDPSGEHVKEVSEEGTEEEKQKLTETDEKKPENGDKQVADDKEEDVNEEKVTQENDKESKPKKVKRKIPFPTKWCGGKRKADEELHDDDNESGNGDTKAINEDQDSGKGDTLAKIDEEDNKKK